MATQYKPIIFSTEMVKAILEGRKTQTRRIMTDWGQHSSKFIISGQGMYVNKYPKPSKYMVHFRYPEDLTDSCGLVAPIQPGDILWVRETWQTTWNENKKSWDTIYKADGDYWIDDDGIMKWKPSIYMPKKRARIFLEVTNVRVERLRDISEDDAIAEGVEIIDYAESIFPVFRNYLLKEKKGTLYPRLSFRTLWEKINGQDSWESNPWVWVYEFKVVEKPKDFTHEH